MPRARRKNGRDQVVADMRKRGAVLLGGQPLRVRNRAGDPIPCVWGECWRDGDTRYRIEENNPDAPNPHMPGGKIIRIFCSETHRDMWVNQARDLIRRGPLGSNR